MEAVQENKKWTGKRIGKLVVDIVCWIFFVFALVFTVFAFTAQSSVAKFPTIGGKAMLTVESDSMEGDHGFKVGDLIISKVLPDANSEKQEDKDERAKTISELKVTTYNADGTIAEYGDVITFWKDLNADGVLELNTHRIIGTVTRSDNHYEFVTKGDHNQYKDSYTVLDNDIVGVWTGGRAPGLGGFIKFLQPPQVGFFVCIILPLAAFLAYEVVVLVLAVRKAKGVDNKVISAAEEELIKQRAIEEYIAQQKADEAHNKSKDEK